MGRRAAIRVNDDLAAGQARIAVRSADLERPGRVDVIDGRIRKQFGRQKVCDDFLHVGLEFGFLLALVIARLVLGRYDHGGAGYRLAVLETQGHLALRIGLQERRRARVAIRSHALQDLVAVIQRRRHQVGRFIAGEAEHDALIARAFVLVAAGVNALGDMLRLAVQVVREVESLPVESVLLVTDVLHGLADALLDFIESARCPFAVFVHAPAADLARQHHAIRCRQRLAGDARFGILAEEQIDDGVGNLV